jgi:hypothetical protein
MKKDHDRENDANRDPITGAPGSHPLGTGAGAAGAGAAGAAIGAALGGPVGAIIGGAAGAIAGGAAGHTAAERVNPTREDAYWRENYSSRPYVNQERGYEYYQPAYQYGWESRARHEDRQWDEVERDLESNWAQGRGSSSMSWNEARPATYDAWHRTGIYDDTQSTNANLSGSTRQPGPDGSFDPGNGGNRRDRS